MHYLSLFPFSKPAPRWKFIATCEYIDEGMVIPRGYAIAYRDIRMNTKVCYPVGLHLLVRWRRDFLFWLFRVGYPGYRQRKEQEMYALGLSKRF